MSKKILEDSGSDSVVTSWNDLAGWLDAVIRDNLETLASENHQTIRHNEKCLICFVVRMMIY